MTWLILVAVGFGLGYWMGKRAAPTNERRDAVVGLLDQVAEITNNDVERALGVSDATATRVLDTLEKSGDITQVGTTGSGVVYRKKY
jgi:predicted HTH transcriptional regulator